MTLCVLTASYGLGCFHVLLAIFAQKGRKVTKAGNVHKPHAMVRSEGRRWTNKKKKPHAALARFAVAWCVCSMGFLSRCHVSGPGPSSPLWVQSSVSLF